jgi:hypothetical protein
MAFEYDEENFEFGDVVTHKGAPEAMCVVLGRAPQHFTFIDDIGSEHSYTTSHVVLVALPPGVLDRGLTWGTPAHALKKKED